MMEGKESDQQMNQLLGPFTTDWSLLLDEVTKLYTLDMFNDIGIEIDHVFQEAMHLDDDRKEMEADVIMVSSTSAIVVVEVETILTKEHVDHFLKQMKLFKSLYREYKDRTVYVAVAAIKFDGDSDVYARKKGVFVLRCNGESIFGLDNVPEERRRKY